MARRNKTPAEQDRDRVLERIRSGELDRETGQRLRQDANQRLYDQNIDPHTGGPFLAPEDEAGLEQRQQERELVPASQRIFPPGTGISLPEEADARGAREPRLSAHCKRRHVDGRGTA